MPGSNPISVIWPMTSWLIVRRGLAALSRWKVNIRWYEAQNGEEAIQCAEQTPAQIMILIYPCPDETA
ncbi:MAG: hypothetical protein U0401_17575 [Anaerolineae bacterium]